MFIITKTFTDDEGHLFTKVNLKAGKLASKEEYLPLLTELYYVGYKKNELEVCQFARI